MVLSITILRSLSTALFAAGLMLALTAEQGAQR
jgi:hypothetical protein